MQSSGTTDDLEPGDGPHATEPATAPLEVPRSLAGEPILQHSPVSGGRDQCGACGAQLASDQRYCVECGQRRGRSRVEFMEQLAPRAETATAGSPRRRLPRMSANAALIAAVGTLILAMGVGVLIGRSAAGEKSGNIPIKVVTVGGGTGTATTTTPTTGTESSTTAGSGKAATTGSSGSGSASKSKSKTSSKSSATKAAAKSKPKAKVVKIGSHGKGAGYNKKEEFTGEFFGKGEE